MRTPNREELHSDKAIWDELEKQADADWRWHGIKMLIVGAIIGAVGLWLGMVIGFFQLGI